MQKYVQFHANIAHSSGTWQNMKFSRQNSADLLPSQAYEKHAIFYPKLLHLSNFLSNKSIPQTNLFFQLVRSNCYCFRVWHDKYIYQRNGFRVAAVKCILLLLL